MGFAPYVVIVGDEGVDSGEGEANSRSEAHGLEAGGALVDEAGGGGGQERVGGVLLVPHPGHSQSNA